MLLLGMILFAFPFRTASAEDAITVLFATLKPVNENWAVDAAMNVRLNRTQEEALMKGIPLQFVTEFELERVRTWWLNEELVATSRSGRLSYSPLTRRYQVESVEAYKAFDTLLEALTELGRIEKWVVATSKTLKPGNTYIASIRMRLDTGQLSKPLQISALASGKWDAGGDWHKWEVSP